MSVRLIPVVMLLIAALAGCEDEALKRPLPVEVSADATGHYCGMLLKDHSGPKGQIHLVSSDAPIWFSSVRDTIAFTRLPEEPRDIAAIYVNDMGRTANWDQPDPGTWTDAREAWFVIESSRTSGMGAPEAVPFSEQAAADAFRQEYGGRIVRLDEIPDDYVLGSTADDIDPTAAPSHPASDHES